MSRVLAFIRDKIAEANGPLATQDPTPPDVLRDKPVLFAEFIYKSNPQTILQHRYFVVYKDKLEYYKAKDVSEVRRMQPRGTIEFKNVDSYSLTVEEDIHESYLTLTCGTRNYKLCKRSGYRNDCRYSFNNVYIFQNIISTYQDYKALGKDNPNWVRIGSKTGIRLHEGSPDKIPIFDCEPVLTQEQINLVPCNRVFTVARISDDKDNVFGLVFSNTGLSLIDPKESKLVVHDTVWKRDKKNYLGFHDSIGGYKGLSFRQTKFTLFGFKVMSGDLPEFDYISEKLAREKIKDSYKKELAQMNPLYVLVQCQYFFNSSGLDKGSDFLSESRFVASSARTRQLSDMLLPLTYDQFGNVVIPSMEIPQVTPDLLNYTPELAENRTYIPSISPKLFNDEMKEKVKTMRGGLDTLREIYAEAQTFIQTVIMHEDDFNPGSYPNLKTANMDRQVVGFYMSAYLPCYKGAFEANAWKWSGRTLKCDSDCRHLNAYRQYYAEYHDLFSCFVTLCGQLQSHLEAFIVNKWIYSFLSGDYTTASKYMDFSMTDSRDSTIPTCLSNRHVLAIRRLFDLVVDSYAEMNYNKNVSRFLLPPQTRDHLYMYEMDTGYKKLEFEFVPDLQTFKMITFDGKPFTSVSNDNVFVNHGYTIGRVNNSISSSTPMMVCVNDSLEIIGLNANGRYASYRYSRSGAQHIFNCTYMTDNNRTTIGGNWILNEDTCEMVWEGNKYNTPNCYYRFHVDKGIPPNVALFMAVRNAYGKAEAFGSNSLVQKISNAYKRMVYHNINVADDKDLVKMQASYMNLFDHPEIIPYTPLKFNRVDIFYSQTNAIEWKKTTDLEKDVANAAKEERKREKEERKRKEKEDEIRNMKNETIANLDEIERLMEEGKEWKKKATGRAQLMVSNIFITKTLTRNLTREMIEAETDEIKVLNNLEYSKSDLTTAGMLFDNIKNQVEENND